jgi:hypothetical protein
MLILEIYHQFEEHIMLNTAVEREEVGTVYWMNTQSAPRNTGCEEE